MRTACLPTVRVVVATKCQYQGVSTHPPGPMSGGEY